MKVLIADSQHKDMWNRYVLSNSKATLYHLFEWKNLIKEVYGHDSIYLMALDKKKKILGILPIIFMRSPLPVLLPKKLVSLPFFDMAGVISNSSDVAYKLLNKAISIAKHLGSSIELRQIYPIYEIVKNDFLSRLKPICNRVSMVIKLPDSPEELMASFKSKLRSQIKRPLKEGMYAVVGGEELVEDFYSVFSINMRDLGSPVHSKKMIKALFKYFPDRTKVFVVYYKNIPVASSIAIGFKDRLENPWASSLKKYKRFAPNMLLYWKMLEYGCENGFKYFNFGRSKIGSGTFRFKKQWGSKAYPLYWYVTDGDNNEKEKFSSFIKMWQRLPLSIANFLGPLIRRYISL